jgi:hypothetical protein
MQRFRHHSWLDLLLWLTALLLLIPLLPLLVESWRLVLSGR